MNESSKHTDKNLKTGGIRSWWHKKCFLLAFALSMVITVCQLFWIEYIKPPEGYIYEVNSIIAGKWWSGTCSNNGKASVTCSKIDDQRVYCNVRSYFLRPIGIGDHDNCLRLDIPNGEYVLATDAGTPMLFAGGNKYVTSIYSNSKIYHYLDPAKVASEWLAESRRQALFGFFDFLFLLYIVLTFFPKLQSEEGK